MTTSMSYDATGDPVIKLTVTLVQPTGTTNRGSWVEVTSLDDGTGNPIWDDTAILLFIPAGENSTSIEGVAGNTLYFARAWSVDFVGVPSTKTASEQQVTIKDEVAPNVPSNFVAVGSIKAILASWTPSSAQTSRPTSSAMPPTMAAAPGWGPPRTGSSSEPGPPSCTSATCWPRAATGVRCGRWTGSGNVDDNGTTRDYLDFPDVGYSALVSVDTTLVNADLIAIGAVQPQHIAYLTADMIQSGILHINTSQTSMFDGIKVYADDGVTEIGRWDDTGLYIRSASDPDSYIQLTDDRASPSTSTALR